MATRNVPPADAYRGADREALRAQIKQAWTYMSPKYPPLKIVLNGGEWRRSVSWVWAQDRWRKVDSSTLAGFVFYKGSDRTAYGHGVVLIKDHLNRDAIRVKTDPAQDTPPNWGQVYLLGAIR